jgi:type I restriction enzyme R subunit
VHNFGVVFPELFQKALLERMDRNEKVVFKYLDDSDLAADVVRIYATLAQARAKVGYQQHCPIGELLDVGENAHLEYKSTLRTGAERGELYKPLETASLKTIAAFANSNEGGTLLIGVADDGSVHGLASDYATLHKQGKDNRDLFLLHLNQLLINAMGETAASTTSSQVYTIDGDDICRVHVPPSSFPVDAKVVIDKKGQMLTKTAFYVRIGNGTREIGDPDERQKYIATRWGSTTGETQRSIQ